MQRCRAACGSHPADCSTVAPLLPSAKERYGRAPTVASTAARLISDGSTHLSAGGIGQPLSLLMKVRGRAQAEGRRPAVVRAVWPGPMPPLQAVCVVKHVVAQARQHLTCPVHLPLATCPPRQCSCPLMCLSWRCTILRAPPAWRRMLATSTARRRSRATQVRAVAAVAACCWQHQVSEACWPEIRSDSSMAVNRLQLCGSAAAGHRWEQQQAQASTLLTLL